LVVINPRESSGILEARRAAPLLAYFGHHKCASSWLTDITRDVAAAAGLRYAHFHNPRMFQGDLRTFVERNDVSFLAYVNANRTYLSALDGFRGFHVIRDPRDIVVSSYFSHLHSHPTTDWPELVKHRRELQSIDKDHGLYVVIDFLSDVLADMSTWDYSDPRILELKMEDVVREPVKWLREALEFIGLVESRSAGIGGDLVSAVASLKRRRPWMVPFRIVPLPASILEDSIRRNAYEVKANGRAQGVENVSSHYRKGVSGDWVNHLGPRHREYFKARHGELLVKLGYESDLDW